MLPPSEILLRANRWFAFRVCGLPLGVTISGYTWNREQRGGAVARFMRKRLDGVFLILIGQEQHCRHAWDRDVQDTPILAALMPPLA